MIKKWFAMLLALVLCVGLATAAQAATEVASGTCSTDGNVKWTLDSDGVLTISGSGTMTNYSSSSSRPWDSNQVMAVVVEEGVESIGIYAFSGYTNLVTVTINGKLSSIGSNAFSGCTNLETVTINEGLGTIGSNAFSGCTNLKTVTINGEVDKIGSSAFARCTSLTTFTYEGKNEPGGNSTVFSGCALLRKVNVPAGYTSDTFRGIEVTRMPDSGSTTYSVTIAEGIENGAVTAEPTSAVEGETVTLTVAPDNQYSLKEISASDASGSVTLTQVEGEGNQYTFTMPASDVTVTAAFTINTYTVTWKNWDGTVLEIDENVPYGTTPAYDGATPTKAGDAQTSYTFAGWAPVLADVTGDITYTAAFTSSTNTYTVTWQNWDGTVLETDENVPYGTTPAYDGATPTKAGDAQTSYTFAGWAPVLADVTGDITYTATFTSSTNTYTVTWQNWDGTVLETDTDVPYGTTPAYDGATPTKADDGQNTYTFAGWNPAIRPCDLHSHL